MSKSHQWDGLDVPVDLLAERESSEEEQVREKSLSRRLIKSIRQLSGLDLGTHDKWRVLYVGRERNEEFKYPNNTVTTSRYTVLTFVPKFLFESFRKFANTYYLIISIFQMIPAISITDGIPLTLIPLAIVLLFESVITALEDRQRHIDDAKANSSKCLVIEKGTAVQKTWNNIRVGDIVKLRNREQTPADILIIAASDDPPQGVCYVETKSLDGETNLKIKQGQIETAEAIDSYAQYLLKKGGMTKEEAMDQATSTLQGKIICEKPNAHLDTFSGSATFRFENSEGMARISPKLPISIKNVILRGCTVRSTDYMYGIVLNTGHDTKIMQSMVRAKSKMSTLDSRINQLLAGFLLLEILICLLGAGLAWDWVKRTAWEDVYINQRFTLNDFFIRACTFFLLICQMIPLSLYVSMRLIRIIASVFIWWDIEMINEGIDPISGEKFQHRAVVRSMDLCDTIGQISFVFSDKTGTLTNNVMEFRKMSIAGKVYGRGSTIIGVAALEREGRVAEAIAAKAMLESLEAKPHPRFINFVEDQFGAALQANAIPGAREFLTALALCHEVLIETVRDEDGRDLGKTRFSASSPDDQALVVAASEMGFKFCARGEGGRSITVLECAPSDYILDPFRYESMSSSERTAQEETRTGTEVVYDLLYTLEFSSARKRASVIVRDRCSGQIILYSKGADSEILKRLSPSARSFPVTVHTMQQITAFADDGLRTLTIARRILNEGEFAQWQTRYQAAISNVAEQERRKNKEDNMIDKLMDEIEVDLEILGATAIEDKLQDQVPETIRYLALAGIRLWVLTGDKEETAINIAWACQLIDHTMTRIIINAKSASSTREMIDILRKHASMIEEESKLGKAFALVIDGPALKLALLDSTEEDAAICEKLLIDIAIQCKGVICCRVSPKQKADIVRTVRKYLSNECTLAVGDGANDVGMIQSAHVGVGISGLEGMQAVNAADMAIGRFKYLKRLLLLHGRTNYRRTAKIIVLLMYKNILMILCQIFWSHANGYSGQRLYFQLGVEGYNLIFTNSLVFTSPFDKDLPDRYVLQLPQLYDLGRDNQLFNAVVFWSYIFNAWYQSFLAYIFMYYAYQVPDEQDTFMMGTMTFTIICCVANTKVALETSSWRKVSVIGWTIIFFSWPMAAAMFESRMTLNVRFGWEFQDVFTMVLASPATWALWVVMYAAMLFRDVAWKAIKREWFPELRHILQEHARLSGLPFEYVGPIGDFEGGLEVLPADGVKRTSSSNSKEIKIDPEDGLNV